jgi:N-carbamoyl-L-amino-acid hydrolase
MKISVRAETLADELKTLAQFSDAPPPAVTRIVFSEQDIRARVWLTELCGNAGLEVRQDAIGNMFARWRGADADAAAVGTGSHIDAIPYSGRFDGVVGVLGGLEAIRALRRSGFKPRRSIELLIFTSEEPTRFGIGCLGSRLLSRSLPAEKAASLRDADGRSVDEVRTSAGFTGSLETVALPCGYYAAFVDLHIEQGPLLERHNVPIGVVTAIAAPAGLEVVVEGSGGHAGAVLMPDRRDALVSAAELVLGLDEIARSTAAPDSVATAGICEVFPGAINSIPSRVRLGIDIRDIDAARRDGMLEAFEARCAKVVSARGVQVKLQVINRDPPAACAADVVAVLVSACQAQGLQCERMVSRAYHDSLFMSLVCPVSMLFIPCRDGVSHRPDEFASIEAIEAGTRILADALANLAA